jgi:hypothetical protein
MANDGHEIRARSNAIPNGRFPRHDLGDHRGHRQRETSSAAIVDA